MTPFSPRTRTPSLPSQEGDLDALAVVGRGACTPLGLTAAATWAEVRAGTTRFAETGVADAAGDPVRACSLPLLGSHASRIERVAALLTEAVAECLGSTVASELPEPLAVLLVLPAGATLEPVDAGPVCRAVRRVCPPGLELALAEEETVRGGRAGLFRALSAAGARLTRGTDAAVLVAAADSRCDPASLSILSEAHRTLGRTNPDGLLPGEGAGAALLASASHAQRRAWPAVAHVLAVARATEPHPARGDVPSGAEGLSTAFRRLRTDPLAGTTRTDCVLSCQTGESAWEREFAYAYLRNDALMPEPLVITHLAASIGDAGAGTAAVHLALAPDRLDALESSVAGTSSEQDLPARRGLLYGSASDGSVGACVVERRLDEAHR